MVASYVVWHKMCEPYPCCLLVLWDAGRHFDYSFDKYCIPNRERCWFFFTLLSKFKLEQSKFDRMLSLSLMHKYRQLIFVLCCPWYSSLLHKFYSINWSIDLYHFCHHHLHLIVHFESRNNQTFSHSTYALRARTCQLTVIGTSFKPLHSTACQKRIYL